MVYANETSIMNETKVEDLWDGTTFITQTGPEDNAAAKPPKKAFTSITLRTDAVPYAILQTQRCVSASKAEDQRIPYLPPATVLVDQRLQSTLLDEAIYLLQ